MTRRMKDHALPPPFYRRTQNHEVLHLCIHPVTGGGAGDGGGTPPQSPHVFLHLFATLGFEHFETPFFSCAFFFRHFF